MTSAPFERLQSSIRAARRSSTSLLGWRMRRRYRFARRRMGSCAGARVLDVGGAQGIFAAMLVRAGAAEVVVVEPQEDRVAIGRRLQRDPRVRFEHADVLARLELVARADTVTALHCLHQLGPRVHALFEAIAASQVKRIVLQGGTSHAERVQRAQAEGLYGSALGLPDGMIRLLERYGFQATLHDHRRYPVVIGARA
jgi:SAM-dependent methyltransferase